MSTQRRLMMERRWERRFEDLVFTPREQEGEVRRCGREEEGAYSVDNMKLKNYSLKENVSSFSAKYYMGYTHARPEYGVF